MESRQHLLNFSTVELVNMIIDLEEKAERYEKALKDIQKCADFEELVQEICENALKS